MASPMSYLPVLSSLLVGVFALVLFGVFIILSLHTPPPHTHTHNFGQTQVGLARFSSSFSVLKPEEGWQEGWRRVQDWCISVLSVCLVLLVCECCGWECQLRQVRGLY